MMKRKRYSNEFKARVALEAIREELTLAELSKKHGVHPNMISGWKRAAIKNMADGFGKDDGGTATATDRPTREDAWRCARSYRGCGA